jgi:transcriptional regulator with XRE-family HTH domain
LKATREQAGLSQRELAERAGAHYMTVSKVERGAIEPAWPLVLALARALGVSVAAFEVGEVELPEVKPPAPRGRPRKATSGPSGSPGADGPAHGTPDRGKAQAKVRGRRKEKGEGRKGGSDRADLPDR